jgi:hypothetical protein
MGLTDPAFGGTAGIVGSGGDEQSSTAPAGGRRDRSVGLSAVFVRHGSLRAPPRLILERASPYT